MTTDTVCTQCVYTTATERADKLRPETQCALNVCTQPVSTST